jgi:CTP synthase
MLAGFDAVLVPGGFGQSGIEGILMAIRYARENNIPYFGLCYGMQLMCIEYARNVLGLRDANTAEIDPNAQHKIIDIMPDQKLKLAIGNYGASMRLGSYPCVLKPGTVAERAYSENVVENPKNSVVNRKNNKKIRNVRIDERHRHRYEVNPEYIEQLEAAGLVFSGTSPDGKLMEIAELENGSAPRNSSKASIASTLADNPVAIPGGKHPFFLGTQFHPEFLARPLHPHPLFTAFVKAAFARKKKSSS